MYIDIYKHLHNTCVYARIHTKVERHFPSRRVESWTCPECTYRRGYMEIQLFYFLSFYWYFVFSHLSFLILHQNATSGYFMPRCEICYLKSAWARVQFPPLIFIVRSFCSRFTSYSCPPLESTGCCTIFPSGLVVVLMLLFLSCLWCTVYYTAGNSLLFSLLYFTRSRSSDLQEQLFR